MSYQQHYCYDDYESNIHIHVEAPYLLAVVEHIFDKRLPGGGEVAYE